MKRLLAAAATAALALTAAPASAWPPPPDHACEGAFDFYCRGGPCGVDELDCGMKICTIWLNDACVA